MLTHRGVPRNPVARSHHILRQETLPALELLPLIPSVTHRTSPITTWGSPDEPSPGFEPGTRSWQERGVANYAHNGRPRAPNVLTLPAGACTAPDLGPPSAGSADVRLRLITLESLLEPHLVGFRGHRPLPYRGGPLLFSRRLVFRGVLTTGPVSHHPTPQYAADTRHGAAQTPAKQLQKPPDSPVRQATATPSGASRLQTAAPTGSATRNR